MIEAAAKFVFAKAVDHWEGITTLILIVLYGRADYRVTQLENRAKKRTVEDCESLMTRCSLVNTERFSDGRRELDGFTAALNRLSDHLEDNNKLIITRLDKITDYVIAVKTSQKEHYEE